MYTQIYNQFSPPLGMPLDDLATENYSNFGAEKNFAGEEESTSNPKKKHTRQDFQEAKDFLDELVWDFATLTPLQAARSYMEQFPDIAAEPLRFSPNDHRRVAWGKFNKTTRPAVRLFGSLDTAHLYTLHAEHLGLPARYSHAENFPLGSYDPEIRDAWKEALKKAFKNQTYFYKLEYASRFHCHVIASHDAALPNLRRDGEVIKRIRPGTEEKVLGYLYKPHATYTENNLVLDHGR